MTAFITSISFFLLIYAVAVVLWVSVFGRRRAVDDRFQALAVKVRRSEKGFEGQFGRDFLDWMAEKVPIPDPESARGEKVAQTLAEAGFKGSARSVLTSFYLARAAMAAALTGVGAFAGIMLGHDQVDVLVCIVAGAMVGLIVPPYYLKRRARLRQARIANELSDVLDLLVVSVEAGLGLSEAIKVVGTESQRQGRIMGRELSIVSAEMAAGRSLGDALRSLAERSAVEDVKPLAATLIQSEQLGSQIGPALRASSDALRASRRLRAEESAQKLSVKILFPLVLLVLPAMLMLILGPAVLEIAKTLNQ